MQHSIFISLIVVLFTTSSIVAHADMDGVAGSGFIPPIQFPARDGEVHGLRFSPGYARHKTMIGLDVGLVGNITDSTFHGVGMAGGFNRTDGKAYVYLAQIALGANVNNGKLRLFGGQLAMANFNKGDAKIYGAQLGFIGNWGSKQMIYGAQVGLVNEAGTVNGFQIGLINKTKNLNGIQIGLVNIVTGKGGLPFFPIINVGF